MLIETVFSLILYYIPKKLNLYLTYGVELPISFMHTIKQYSP